ncbi:hypothetical protein AVEN_198249-1 [Araneus ventricosus]|uniref:Uncharacterized protein n=1 Tax=Araneus ventricosus TaxID=182803 RepID=A0A4Y2X359_ARAVE|nr:hypothetical protein AVEN_198249-1 [Araneus ventricosus]
MDLGMNWMTGLGFGSSAVVEDILILAMIAGSAQAFSGASGKVLLLIGFFGHHVKFAACGSLQWIHLGGVSLGFGHSLDLWGPVHFMLLGFLVQSRLWGKNSWQL